MPSMYDKTVTKHFPADGRYMISWDLVTSAASTTLYLGHIDEFMFCSLSLTAIEIFLPHCYIAPTIVGHK